MRKNVYSLDCFIQLQNLLYCLKLILKCPHIRKRYRPTAMWRIQWCLPYTIVSISQKNGNIVFIYVVLCNTNSITRLLYIFCTRFFNNLNAKTHNLNILTFLNVFFRKYCNQFWAVFAMMDVCMHVRMYPLYKIDDCKNMNLCI